MAEGANKAPFTGCQNYVINLRRDTSSIAVAERIQPTVCMHNAFRFTGGTRSKHDERCIVRPCVEWNWLLHRSVVGQFSRWCPKTGASDYRVYRFGQKSQSGGVIAL